jgi:uncharacterized protein (DUF1330 family)
MVAYWIGRTRIIDPSPMTDYVRLAKLAGEKHPHRTLARGGRSRVLEGETAFDRFVLNEFPSVEAALAFYNSPEYQEAVALRMKASDGRGDLVLLESL